MPEKTLLDPRQTGLDRAPVELTAAEAEQVSGGLNPQPLPPGMEFEGIWLSDHWNR
jgi:hypothetical protein